MHNKSSAAWGSHWLWDSYSIILCLIPLVTLTPMDGQGEDLLDLLPQSLLPSATYCAWQSLSDCTDLAPETVWCWTEGDPDTALWLPLSPPTHVPVSLVACLRVFFGA